MHLIVPLRLQTFPMVPHCKSNRAFQKHSWPGVCLPLKFHILPFSLHSTFQANSAILNSQTYHYPLSPVVLDVTDFCKKHSTLSQYLNSGITSPRSLRPCNKFSLTVLLGTSTAPRFPHPSIVTQDSNCQLRSTIPPNLKQEHEV